MADAEDIAIGLRQKVVVEVEVGYCGLSMQDFAGNATEDPILHGDDAITARGVFTESQDAVRELEVVRKRHPGHLSGRCTATGQKSHGYESNRESGEYTSDHVIPFLMTRSSRKKSARLSAGAFELSCYFPIPKRPRSQAKKPFFF
jgi:hypothetical protein